MSDPAAATGSDSTEMIVPFRTRCVGHAMMFRDEVHRTWEVRDFTPSLTLPRGVITLDPEQIYDNLEEWLTQQESQTVAEQYAVYRLGHPYARRRAFLLERSERSSDSSSAIKADRFCELNTVADHRWYPQTIEEQFGEAQTLDPLVRARLSSPIEDGSPIRLVPLQSPSKRHSRRPLVRLIYEDVDGHLWRVRDMRYGHGRRRGGILSEPGTDPHCVCRVFEPWEHVDEVRIFKFPSPGVQPISPAIASEFASARRSGRGPSDYSVVAVVEPHAADDLVDDGVDDAE